MKTLLLILGAPLWLPLSLAALAVLLSLYLSLWAVLLSLWAVLAATALASICASVYGVGLAVLGHAPSGLAMLGCGMFAFGASAPLLFLCLTASRATLLPTRRFSLWLERRRYRV